LVRILAARSGVSAKVIEAIEAGRAPASLPVSAVDRLARALHLPVASLLDLHSPREPGQASSSYRTPRKERPR
jgi:transcriptional regulator with XRE-family HTH domain